MKTPAKVNVLDVFMFGGDVHRVLELPVSGKEGSAKDYIDIRNGKLIEIDNAKVSMRLKFCEFSPDINMHEDAKALIVKHFAR